MTPLVTIALYGWIPVSLLIFRELRGYRGLIACYVAATLLLPEYTFEFGGIPDYSKRAATAYGVILAAILFEPKSLFRYRAHWFDLPILLFCLLPIPSALSNNLSIMDGVTISIELTLGWGVPYFLGRVFLQSFESIRAYVYGVFLGALAYLPFCLFEIRMSPQLNKLIYGFSYNPGLFNAVRYGGYRPKVFLKDGLELGLWMTAATLFGFCIVRFRLRQRAGGVRFHYAFAAVLLTTILCKSTGAILLLLGGTTLLYFWEKTRWRWPIYLLALCPMLYVGVRSTQTYDFHHVVEAARSTFGPDRAQSLQFRMENEDLLVERAFERPILGWTGFGKNRVRNDDGKVISITDGYWVIVLGTLGFVGLILFYSSLLAIPTLCVARFSSRRYSTQDAGPVIAVCLFTLILSVDCLLNAFWNCVYPIGLGGLTTLYLSKDAKLIDDVYVEQHDEVVSTPQRTLWPPPPREPEIQVTT